MKRTNKQSHWAAGSVYMMIRKGSGTAADILIRKTDGGGMKNTEKSVPERQVLSGKLPLLPAV